MKRIIISSVLLTMSSISFAAKPNAYIGVSMGKSTFESGISNPAGTASLTEDGSPTKIFGGYNYGNNWSFELSYVVMGTVAEMTANNGDTFELDGVVFVSLVDGLKLSIDGTATTLSAKYTAPVNNQFGVYGKLGMASYTLDAKLSGPLGSGTLDSVSNSAVTYGLGASYAITKEVSGHLDYDYYNFESGDNSMGMFSLGVSYSF